MHDALKRYVFFLFLLFFITFFHYFCWCCCFYCLSVRLLLILLLLLLLLLESNSYVQKCSLVWGKVLRSSFCVCVFVSSGKRDFSRLFFFLPNWVYWKTDLFFVIAIIRSTHGLCFLYIFLFKLFKFTFVAYACFCFRLMCVVFFKCLFWLVSSPTFLFVCLFSAIW